MELNELVNKLSDALLDMNMWSPSTKLFFNEVNKIIEIRKIIKSLEDNGYSVREN